MSDNYNNENITNPISVKELNTESDNKNIARYQTTYNTNVNLQYISRGKNSKWIKIDVYLTVIL